MLDSIGVPFELSVWFMTGAGQLTEGVILESTHTELQRFFNILGFGQGVLEMHCCKSLAIHKAAKFCTAVFSSFFTDSINGLIIGLSFSGSCMRLMMAQAANMCTLSCSTCHSWLVSTTVI